MSKTFGRRLPDGPHNPFILSRGAYWREEGSFYAVLPNGLFATLAKHDIIEHEDGTITVSPSILTTGHDIEGNPIEWHGYLENGMWREA